MLYKTHSSKCYNSTIIKKINNDLLTKLKVLIITGKYISEYNEGNEFIIHLLKYTHYPSFER